MLLSEASTCRMKMPAWWPFTSDLRHLIMAVATNDEGKKSCSCTGPFLASIRNQSAFAKWKQAFIQEHKKSDQRQVRKQHNMINTTTSQPYDPWEIFENTIKHREQTNMSIKASRLWNPEKNKNPCCGEYVLCNNSLKTEQNQHIYKCSLVLLDNPCPFFSKSATVSVLCFLCNRASFYFCTKLESSFIIFLFVHYS